MLFSTDAGLNWGIVSGVSGNLKSIKFKNPTEGYCGGQSSQYRTVNGGISFIFNFYQYIIPTGFD